MTPSPLPILIVRLFAIYLVFDALTTTANATRTILSSEGVLTLDVSWLLGALAPAAALLLIQVFLAAWCWRLPVQLLQKDDAPGADVDVVPAGVFLMGIYLVSTGLPYLIGPIPYVVFWATVPDIWSDIWSQNAQEVFINFSALAAIGIVKAIAGALMLSKPRAFARILQSAIQ